jgi:histone-lysine N-methyltransferase SETMAR
LDSPLHTRIQTAVKTVDRSQLFSAEEKVGSISRKGHGINIWDAEGILFIDDLEKDKTISGKYNSNLLTRLDKKICEKRPGLQKKNIIFLQDNAPAHKRVLAMRKLRDLHYELLEHPPYSPDLAPSDFYPSPKLNPFLARQRFSSNEVATAALERYFADHTKNQYRDRIIALEHRWNKCISLKRDYVEK